MTLQNQKCRECFKAITVAPYSPWDGEEEPTGCHATRWNYDSGRDRHVGYICLECAFDAAMRDKAEPGIHGILGGPGPDWSFGYTG